ncbi:MAG: TatD family hydrolase [Actinobacteria bacterium]|nr:TatD family hydrolase [Actinomycetota bacterium]
MQTPSPYAVDTHCHLFLMDQEAGRVVSAAAAAGVERLVCVGIDPATSRRSVELAESFRGVFATAGMHPHTASDFDGRAGAEIEELLADPMVVGVGETGLDYYRRLSPVEDQHRAFRTHIALSRESGKPLVVHVRDAWPDAMAILAEERAERVVLHCFSGDAAHLAEAQARGYLTSFAANITYPGADSIRGAAAASAPGLILAETDSPFLPPQSLRGRPNEPGNVMHVLAALAETRNLTLQQMVEETSAAAIRTFPLLR